MAAAACLARSPDGRLCSAPRGHAPTFEPEGHHWQVPFAPEKVYKQPACFRGRHFWTADNGRRCQDCGWARWEISPKHPDYRPQPST